MHNHHRGHRGGRLPLFFEGQSSFLGRSRRGPPVASPLAVPSSDKEVHSNHEIFREIEDYIVEAEREDHVHQMSDSLRERVRLVALGLQLVELRPWTATLNTSIRTGYLGFLLRNWDSSLVNIGRGIWLARPLRMRDHTFLLTAT